jgi:cytochrome c553
LPLLAALVTVTKHGVCLLFRFPQTLLVFAALIAPQTAFSADKKLGEERYNQTCIACHGPAGKGVSSYPKISGKEISYTIAKLEAYRKGIEQGPNSSLMIMMAQPLTDEEISNLAAYLEDAKYVVE